MHSQRANSEELPVIRGFNNYDQPLGLPPVSQPRAPTRANIKLHVADYVQHMRANEPKWARDDREDAYELALRGILEATDARTARSLARLALKCRPR